jgi:hypothetical protein
MGLYKPPCACRGRRRRPDGTSLWLWGRRTSAWRCCRMPVVSMQVSDIALEDYIAVKPKFAVYVPHTAGRYQKRRFRKALCPIVERCVAG